MPQAREIAFRQVSALLTGIRPGARPPGEPEADGSAREGRLAAEIAHGVVRHLTRIDWLIAHYAGKAPAKIVPAALTVVRIGVYQLVFMPSIPRYAAVSESVSLAREVVPRAAGFVNWLLRRVGPEAAELPRRDAFGSEEAWLAASHSFPAWMVRRWIRRFGPGETARLLAALNLHPAPGVRVNLAAAGVAEIEAALRAAGFETTPGRYAPAALSVRGAGRLTELGAFTAGQIYLQDESSQLAPLALAPRPGERILDACAGVGGKSTHLAEITGDAATIVAVDQDASRLAGLQQNARRRGFHRIECRRGDLLDPALLAGERFDAVLLDAPCSGLGTIPRHPELKWVKRASDPVRLAALQGRLLARAAALLAPGGRIVYSTCTTEPEENELLVKGFLADRPAFRVARPSPGAIANLEELLTPEGYLRTWPHRHGIGGAFIALLAGR
jgi:16S rRNA (cytosine967-C5)-methyltransferase